MAPSVSTGDGGRNVAGEYLVAEPLDYFHFADPAAKAIVDLTPMGKTRW